MRWWFEPLTSWVISLFSFGVPFVKEKTTKTIPAEYWANQELKHKDLMSGMSDKEILKNAERGRYYIPKEIFQAYPIPHRDPKSNKILIENYDLYQEDVMNHGAVLAQKWVKQGKYNLNKYDREIATLLTKRKMATLLGNHDEAKEIDRRLSGKKLDWHNTEAVQQWKKAYDAENKYY